MGFSPTEENYIKAIWRLQEDERKLSTNLLSAEMQTKPATVTDMLQKLEYKGLLDYRKYKGFRLTDEGVRVAVRVVRKHRLWEYFLVNKLGFAWEEVHSMAEELEHVSGEALISRLDDYLGNPAFDPHGDPIPDHLGKFRTVKQENLSLVALGKEVEVSFVKNQQTEMLDLLNHHKIGIGTRLTVLRRFSFDGSAEIALADNTQTIISNLVAQNVYCRI